jgi:hypothetical protein
MQWYTHTGANVKANRRIGFNTINIDNLVAIQNIKVARFPDLINQ